MHDEQPPEGAAEKMLNTLFASIAIVLSTLSAVTTLYILGA